MPGLPRKPLTEASNREGGTPGENLWWVQQHVTVTLLERPVRTRLICSSWLLKFAMAARALERELSLRCPVP